MNLAPAPIVEPLCEERALIRGRICAVAGGEVNVDVGARESLGEVRRRGVKIAVDDLGAGYSNLKYIADLEPEVVKLDRGMIAGIKGGSRQYRLLQSIVTLCRQQGAMVVVEGIETKDECQAALDSGAEYGQGYFFARPAEGLVGVDWSSIPKE